MVAVVGCVPTRSSEFSGGAVAAVRGFDDHRLTGYQGISDERRLLPATLRAQLTTQVGHGLGTHPYGPDALY